MVESTINIGFSHPWPFISIQIPLVRILRDKVTNHPWQVVRPDHCSLAETKILQTIYFAWICQQCTNKILDYLLRNYSGNSPSQSLSWISTRFERLNLIGQERKQGPFGQWRYIDCRNRSRHLLHHSARCHLPGMLDEWKEGAELDEESMEIHSSKIFCAYEALSSTYWIPSLHFVMSKPESKPERTVPFKPLQGDMHSQESCSKFQGKQSNYIHLHHVTCTLL